MSSIATLSNGTRSHPMDVAVFGVAMVIIETLFHPTDVRVCVERAYIIGRESFIAWQLIVQTLFVETRPSCVNHRV